MEIPNSVVQEIYDCHKANKLYCLDKATALYQLTNTVDSLYIELFVETMRRMLMGHTQPNIIENNMIKLRHSYRAIIKFIYECCIEDLFSDNIDDNDLNDWSKELLDADKFNETRNRIERYLTNKIEARYEPDSKTIEFFKKESKRNYDVDTYNRWMSRVKPTYYSNQHKEDSLSKKVIAMNKPDILYNMVYSPYLLANNNSFKQTYKVAHEAILSENDVDNDYEFGGFNLFEYYKVYAYITALAMNRLNYYSTSLLLNKIIYGRRNNPSLLLDKKWLIERISEFCKIDLEIVGKIIDLLIYNSDFHKDRIAIYQPLFEINGKICFSSMLVVFSCVQDKLFHLKKKDDNCRVSFSLMAKEKEVLMTDRIINYIQNENEEWIIKRNCLLKINKQSLAEIDICIYDKKHKNLLLIELKWFEKLDGENDDYKTDRKLKDTINSRTDKEIIISKNLKEFIEQNLDSSIEVNQIKSCIISENYSGSVLLEEKLPILDEYLFFNLCDKNVYNMAMIFDKLDRRDYYPSFSPFEHFVDEWEYAGYFIKADRIALN